MLLARSLRRTGLLAGLVSLVAASCSSDTIDLLPLGDSGGSAGTLSGAGLAPGSDAGAGAREGSGGGISDPGGAVGGDEGGLTAGTTTGGRAEFGGCGSSGCGGYGGSFGGGFAGGGYAGSFGGYAPGGGFGGGGCALNGVGQCSRCQSDEQCGPYRHCSHFLGTCVECENKSQCDKGQACDIYSGHCVPGCQSTADCTFGGLCDPDLNTCTCIDDGQCEQDNDPKTHYCAWHRCVQCKSDRDCGPMERCDEGNGICR